MTLSEILQSKDSSLFGKFESIKSKAGELLSRLYSAHPTFTGHDVPHSVNVEAYMGKLLKDDLKASLSAYELFFLLCSAYLHDIGMIASTEELKESDSATIIRNSHHIRSKEYILKEHEYLGLTHNEADILSNLCYAHRVVDINTEVKDTAIGVDNTIRLKLLSACLMIADELDITADRAPEIIARTVGLSKISIEHFEKHLSTIGVAFKTTDNKITIEGKVISSSDYKNLTIMHGDIVRKYNLVRGIFAAQGTEWQNIELNLDKSNYLRYDVFLKLCKAVPLDNDNVTTEFPDDCEAVMIILRDYSLKGELRKDENNKYRLVSSLKQFKLTCGMFLGTEYEMEFTKSDYARSCIVDFLIPSVEEIYKFTYDAGEKEDREIILTNSPNALKLYINNEFPKNTGLLTVNRIIDISIIQGYLIDLFKHPEIGTQGTKLASETILSQVQKEIPSLIHLLSAISINTDNADINNNAFETLTDSNAGVNEKGQHKIDLKLKESKDVEPHLTIDKVFRASLLTGQKLTIDSKNIESFKVTDPTGKVTSEGNLINLVITPHGNKDYTPNIVPQTLYFRIEEDLPKSKLYIYLNTNKLIDLNRYPYFATVNPLTERNKVNIRFDTNPFISPKELLRYLHILTRAKESLIRRICIIDDFNPDIRQEYLMPPIESGYLSQARLQCLQLLCDNIKYSSEYDVLKYIPEDVIDKLADYIKDKSIDTAEDYAGLVDEFSSKTSNFVLVRLTTLDDTGKCVTDDFSHFLDGLIGPVKVNISMYKTLKEKFDTENMFKNQEMAFGTTRYSPVDAFELSNVFKKAIREKRAIPSVLDIEKSSKYNIEARSQVIFELSEVRKSIGIRYQVAHLTIKPSSEWDKLVLLSDYEFQQNNIPKCLEYNLERVKLKNDDYLALGMIGWLYYLMEQYDLSEEYTLKAINISDVLGIGFGYYNYGLLLLRKQKYAEARTAYEKALTICQGDVVSQSIADVDDLIKSEGQTLDLGECNKIRELLVANDNYIKLDKVTRNQPCPCGSKKKFKKCCGAELH